MSAVNIFDTPEGVMIFTDAAMYDADGVLVDLTTKAKITASGLVVTGRGNAAFSLLVEEALVRLRWDIDDVEEHGEHMIETGFAMAEQKFLDAVGRARNDIWIVGWSERDGKAKIAQWSNHAPSGVPRFKLAENVLAPNLSDEGFKRVQAMMVGSDPSKPDFGKVGLAVMKAQRLQAGDLPGCVGNYLVGGHVLRTDVTREGVTQTIVHTWPEDKVGERINPFASAQLSRQQRRALKRQIGRIAA